MLELNIQGNGAVYERHKHKDWMGNDGMKEVVCIYVNDIDRNVVYLLYRIL